MVYGSILALNETQKRKKKQTNKQTNKQEKPSRYQKSLNIDHYGILHNVLIEQTTILYIAVLTRSN